MIAYPDVKVNSSMYTDLAGEFSSQGYNVYVAVANGSHKTSFRREGKVNVLRVRTMELFNTSLIKKGLANLILPYQVSKGINKYLKEIHIDSLIIATPPITYLSTVNKLKKKFRAKAYLILRDIFPQNARDLGLINNRIIFSYFRRKEKQLYALADYIGCMSAGNISYLKRHNPEINKTKLHLLPNWKNVTTFIESDFGIRKDLGLENRFIVIYGGNLGKPQEIEFIIEMAQAIEYIEDVVFLIVGNGTEKNRMVSLCLKKGIRNLIFKDPMARAEYEKLVNICDIGLVVNNRNFTIPNIPSRTLSYWEAKIPVLAAIDPFTDFGSILNESDSGLWSLTGDIDKFKQNFEKLYYNKELRILMGENGYKYLIENCTTSIAYKTIINNINS